MDPIAVAAATLAAKWAAESVVKEAAKSAFTSLRPIYEWVRAKLAGDPAGKPAVDKLESDPKDEGNVASLAALIKDRLDADPTLKPELERLLSTAQEDPKAHSFVVHVLDNAKVGKIVSIGTVQGNVSF